MNTHVSRPSWHPFATVARWLLDQSAVQHRRCPSSACCFPCHLLSSYFLPTNETEAKQIDALEPMRQDTAHTQMKCPESDKGCYARMHACIQL